MKSVEERAKYDDYEMLDEYDFSDGVRGRFYQPKKIPTSMRLDNDILIFLKKQASEKKIAYQTLKYLAKINFQKIGIDGFSLALFGAKSSDSI